MCVCVAVDEEPEQDDVMAEDTSGSEARNETGTPYNSLYGTIRKLRFAYSMPWQMMTLTARLTYKRIK